MFSRKKVFSALRKGSPGQLLVEIVMTMGLFAVMAPALLTGFASATSSRARHEQYTDSASLMKETQSALRSIRSNGWSGFSTNGTFHPVLTNGVWSLASGTETINGFTRSVLVSDVSRNSSGQIVTSGGTVDPSTKLVQITISWDEPFSSSVTSTHYFTRYLDNLLYTETTEAQFLTGTRQYVAVVNNSGGELVLGSGGNGDWCNPGQYIIPPGLDLNQSGKARDLKAVQGRAFVGTDVGASSTFVKVGMSNALPPVLSMDGTMSGYDTNDVFIDSTGTYGYVATKSSSKDVVIVDLASLLEVGHLDDGSNPSEAKGVWVEGNTAYVVSGSRLYTFNVTTKTGSHSPLSSIVLPGAGQRVQAVGSYAYVANDSTTAELQIVNVTNPSSMTLAGTANLNSASGKRLYVNSTGTRTYVATGTSSSQAELFLVNTSTKTGSLSVLGSYEANGMDPTGIAVVPGNRLIMVGLNGEEYQVINTSSETTPVRCGGMDFNAGVYGVSAVLETDGDAFSYIVTKDTTKEFKAFLGGPGGSGAQWNATGTFESATLDAGFTTAFNRVDGSLTIPSQTTLTYQVAVANAVSGSCTGVTFTFVGPDGTSGTSYNTSGGSIPFGTSGTYSNPGRCFRYKATLGTQDSAFTPSFNDIQVNYSP